MQTARCGKLVVVPSMLRFNADHVGDKYERLAEAIGVAASDGLIDAVAELNDRLGIPKGLRAMGVEENSLPSLAEQAVKDHCNATNPRPATAKDYLALFHMAMD